MPYVVFWCMIFLVNLFNTQTQKSRWAAYQGTLDYTGKDFTASATLANPDILSGSGVLALQYLQSMTKRYMYMYTCSKRLHFKCVQVTFLRPVCRM